MSARLYDCWDSFLALPRWVQLWLALVLVPVNLSCLLLLDTSTGRAGALAFAVVVAGNLPIMLVERGMSRLMALPHLVAWFPLLAWLGYSLMSSPGLEGAERGLAWALLLVNGVSLLFDMSDSWRWLRGERAVPRRSHASR